MKISSKDKLSELILQNCDYGGQVRLGPELRTRYYFYADELSFLCSEIIDLFKLAQHIEVSGEEEGISNRIQIAELEAKIKAYETVIGCAEIKLKMPGETEEK